MFVAGYFPFKMTQDHKINHLISMILLLYNLIIIWIFDFFGHLRH